MTKITLWAAILCGWAATAGAGTRAPDSISQDGFESGNTLGWTLTVPALPAATVYRMADLDLRDPHVFTSIPGFPLFGCLDFTDNAFPLGLAPSFNQQIATAITTDGDGDGLLDLSRLLAFRPLGLTAVAGRLDDGDGACTVPPATVCDWQRPPVPVTVAYDGVSVGTCLGPVAGTTSGYSPAVPVPGAPCFTAASRTVTIDFGGVPLTLIDAQSAAQFVLAPPQSVTALTAGLLRGFLTESAADAILIPADIPIVGGRPLSSLLRGGTGSCASGDDRDVHLGATGWWFYFEFNAQPSSFVGQ